MGRTGRRWIGLLAVAAFAVAAVAAPGASAAKRHKKPSCVRAQVAGKRVCLRRGARCDRFKQSAYLDAGFDCVKRGRKRVLVRAKPSAVRQGRYVALPSSGEPTFAQALAAFDSTVADLPGVRPKQGSVGNSDSGSAALRWLYDYRDRLTPAQSKVLERALTPSPDALTVDIDPEGNVFLNADRGLPGIMPLRRAHTAASAAVQQITSIVPQAVARMKAKGVIVGHPVTVSDATEERSDGKAALADAFPGWLRPLGGLLSNACQIRVYARQSGDLAHLRQTLVHELTHCAQYEFISSLGQLGPAPDYVLDGTAEYVAYNISEEWNGAAVDTGWWSRWLRQSRPSLFTRAYDGVGFWSVLAQAGANVYGLIGPLVRAGSALGAYNVAVSGVNPRFQFLWGTSLAKMSAFGPDWDLRTPGAGNVSAPRNVGIGNGSSTGTDIAAKGADVIGLDLVADVIHITTSHPDAEGILRDSAGAEHTLSQQLDYCLRPDACECPDGPDGPEAQFPKLPPGQAFLGFANQRASMAVKILGEKLECDDAKKPGGGGGGGGGGGPGLQIRELLPIDEGPAREPRLLATIKTGKCKFTRGAFSATGKGGGFRFTLRIAGARGPGQYDIVRGSNSTYLNVTGAGGPYSSSGPTGIANGGVVIKREDRTKRVGKKVIKVKGYRISVGMTPLNPPGREQKGVAVIPAPGGLKC